MVKLYQEWGLTRCLSRENTPLSAHETQRRRRCGEFFSGPWSEARILASPPSKTQGPVPAGTPALGWDLERDYLKPIWNHKDDWIKNLALLPRFISASRMLRSPFSSSLALAFPIISERLAKIWTPFVGQILQDHYLECRPRLWQTIWYHGPIRVKSQKQVFFRHPEVMQPLVRHSGGQTV